MSIPDDIRREIRELLWIEAERLDWTRLSASQKARYYTAWTETSSIGMRLSAFMDPRQIRVYIKDTLLKDYQRIRLGDAKGIFRVLGLREDSVVTANYIKPHGRLLIDGKVIAWSRAIYWKLTLMAVYERAFSYPHAIPYAVVLLEAATKYADASSRAVAVEAANRLEIQRLVWLD